MESTKKGSKTKNVPNSSVLTSVTEYTKKLLEGLYSECLIHGNVSSERTKILAEKIKDVINVYTDTTQSTQNIQSSKNVQSDKKEDKTNKNNKKNDKKKGPIETTVNSVKSDKENVFRSNIFPLRNDQNPSQEVVLLPLDRVVLICTTPKNPAENNKCVEAYYQLGESTFFLIFIILY